MTFKVSKENGSYNEPFYHITVSNKFATIKEGYHSKERLNEYLDNLLINILNEFGDSEETNETISKYFVPEVACLFIRHRSEV